MNKKVIGIIVAIIITLAVVIGLIVLISNDSLNNSKNNNDTNKVLGTTLTENDNTINDEGKTEDNTKSSKRILIAYFSRADENYNVGNVDVGNTEIMAGFIKDYLGDKADTFKIDPVKPYPANYKECTEIATEELNSNARPEFKNANSLNLNNYDIIFIGYPIWWYQMPMAMYTLFDNYDFTDKTIIPFNTHEGSGSSGTYEDIQKLEPKAKVLEGLPIRGGDMVSDQSSKVDSWLNKLGI